VFESESSEHHAILVAVLALIGKVIWDWLTSGRSKQTKDDVSELRTLLHEMNDRQKKMWEYMLGRHK